METGVYFMKNSSVCQHEHHFFSIYQLEWADAPNMVFESSESLHNQLEYTPYFKNKTN